MSSEAHNWFENVGQAYSRFRPEYPDDLARYLASMAPARGLCVDVGCGTGQLTRHLAAHFDATIGIDPSADQIANATPAAGVRYLQGPAESLPVADHTACLVTVAQAAHWFDLPAFYSEVRRIAVPEAALALLSYGTLDLEGAEVDARFDRFYRDDIGSYWPPERALVDSGYADLEFPFDTTPFDENPAPVMAIEVNWSLPQLLGYVGTWSAVRRALDAGRRDLLVDFAAELGALWGDPATTRRVTWPLAMRAGIVR